MAKLRFKLDVDKPLALITALLVVAGAMIFASAAFGLLARGASMSSVFFSHLVLGLGVGTVFLVALAFIDYRIWRKYAPYLFVLAFLATAAVFIPQIGFSHGGGTRWLHIFGVSFQPSEALKLGAIFAAAAYFTAFRNKINTIRYGLGGFLGILAAPILILLLQPDLGTLSIICFAVGAIYFAAGASWRDIGIALLVGVLSLAILAMVRPYVFDRIETFLNPSYEQQGQSYQLRQSLIAVGSGGFLGRGFGQGIQKFTYLPEPMGDSIFAVAAEELGFVGALGLIGLFLALGLRGYTVAARTPDLFGALLATGISTYLTWQAFINIAAIIGVAPLTGVPLPFISQGGSSMLISLASVGILLSVSRTKTRRV